MSRRRLSDLELASNILREAREELARADGKSGLLLATASVVIGVVLTAILAGEWDPRSLDDRTEWLWWLGTLCSLAGPTAFACAAWPRRGYRNSRPTGIVSYFGDVVGTRREVLEERLWITALMPSHAVLDQLERVSGIVDKKYRQIQFGMVTLGAGISACLTAATVNNFL